MPRPPWDLKPGVPDATLHPRLNQARHQLALLWGRYWAEIPTVTCTTDGKHMPGSKHYARPCGAIDLRLPKLLLAFLEQARALLGPDFDLVLEPTHLHVEYDPKPKRR
ncbi:MAG TPA: hypothetical protein VEC14_13025 [Reyranellaceae bacterium]|nr:hypothetical protein [Reyranellaceae bacterium]